MSTMAALAELWPSYPQNVWELRSHTFSRRGDALPKKKIPAWEKPGFENEVGTVGEKE